jgi:hypothetical protein
MKPKYNWEQEAANIRNMGLQGIPMHDIGVHYNVSGTYIKKLIVKYNIFADNEVYCASARALKKQENNNARLLLRYGNKDNSELYKAQRRKFIIKQSNMKRAGKQFKLNFGDIVWPEYCPILGIKLNYFNKGGIPQDNSPSFDRIDPTKEYITGNVMIISNKANRLKSDSNINEIRKILEYLENNLH